MSSQRGATFLEILVVVGILAGLMAIVWLARPLLARIALRSAAITLVAELRQVQARAIAERVPERSHGIEFSGDGTRYHVYTRVGSVTTAIREQQLPDQVRLTYVRFGGVTPSSVSFTGVSLFGAPSGGGTVTLSAGDAYLCVRVLPATGRIRLSAAGCP